MIARSAGNRRTAQDRRRVAADAVTRRLTAGGVITNAGLKQLADLTIAIAPPRTPVAALAMPVPDAASVAAMRHLATATGWSTGPSTGTNLWAALRLVDRMRAHGETGSVASLICDGADAYRSTYFDDGWLRQRQLDPDPYTRTIDRFLTDGCWSEPS